MTPSKDQAKITRLFKKAVSYLHSDPEVALMLSRKTAESICRCVYRESISESTKTIMLDELLKQLTTQQVLPAKVMCHLRAIQLFGNYGSHDQDDDHDEMTHEACEPCVKSLSVVYKWYVSDHLKQRIPENLIPPEVESYTPERIQPPARTIRIREAITVRELARLLGIKVNQLIAMFMSLSMFVSVHQKVSKQQVKALCAKLNISVE